MEKIGKDRHQSCISNYITSSRATSRVISCENGLTSVSLRVAAIVNRALFANLFQFKAAGFSKLRLDLRRKYFPIFCQSLLSPYIALWRLIEPCFTTINSAYYLFDFQPSDQTIFLRHTSSLSDHHTRQSDPNSDHTSVNDFMIRKAR